MHTTGLNRHRYFRQGIHPGVFYFLLWTGISAFIGVPPAVSGEQVTLPTYRTGMTFLYSNGRRETVEAVKSDWVTWRNHRGYTSVGSRDFTYRRTQWQTRTRRGTRQIQARNDLFGGPSKLSLWPLAAGNKARYIETGRWQDEKGHGRTFRAQWRAEVVGQERIRVMAGEFDTWKIVADRYSLGTAYSRRNRLRERRTWYYAPAVGHYVRYETDYRGRKTSRVVELVSVRPPLKGLPAGVRSTIDSNFQKALEKNRSGQPLRWDLPGYSAAGLTQPTATFRLAKGRYCRHYIQEFEIGQGQEKYFGLACRDGLGRWRPPQTK